MLATATHSERVLADNKVGSIHLPDNMTAVVRQSITRTVESKSLPSGRYNIDHWIISRTDNKGTPWTCEGSVPEDKSSFEIVEGCETELSLGEPILSVLTATRRGSHVIFSHRLVGQLGEKVRIARDGKRSQAPMLRIKNVDGSYETVLSFKYG